MSKITERYKQHITKKEYEEITGTNGNIKIIYFENNMLGDTLHIEESEVTNIKDSFDMKNKIYLAIRTDDNLDIEDIKRLEHKGKVYYYFEDYVDLENILNNQNENNRYAKVLLITGELNFINEIEYNNIAIVKNASISNDTLSGGEIILVEKTGDIVQEAGEKLATVIIEF